MTVATSGTAEAVAGVEGEAVSGILLDTVLARHPVTDEIVCFVEGEAPPVWAARQAPNPAIWQGGEPPSLPSPSSTSGQSGPPPASGPGSSAEAWSAWARAHGMTPQDGMSRNDIIAACEAAGIPVQ